MPRHAYLRSQRACAQIFSVLLVAAAAAFCAAPHARAAALCGGGRSPSEAAALSSALSRASARVGDEHGLALIDLTTGVVCDQDAGSAMITASIVKVSILGALLMRHEHNGTQLSAAERATAARMIEHSDNSAASALFNAIGGAGGLQRFFSAAGMRASTAHWSWGLTVTTPADQARLLAMLAAGQGVLSDSGRQYMLGLMRSVEPAQRWGVPYRAARGVSVAVKNGWLAAGRGGWHINSLGVFTGGPHAYVMAVMTEGNRSETSGISAVQTLAAAINTTIMGTARQDPDAAPPNQAPAAGSGGGSSSGSGAGGQLGPVPALGDDTGGAGQPLSHAGAFNSALMAHRGAASARVALPRGPGRHGVAAVQAASASLDESLTPRAASPWPSWLAWLAACSAGALAGGLLLRRRLARASAPDPHAT